MKKSFGATQPLSRWIPLLNSKTLNQLLVLSTIVFISSCSTLIPATESNNTPPQVVDLNTPSEDAISAPPRMSPTTLPEQEHVEETPQGEPPTPSLTIATEENALTNSMRELLSNQETPLDNDSIGYYMDVQYASLQQKFSNHAVNITRHEDEITIILPGNDSFNSNSATLTPTTELALRQVAAVLSEYDKTLIIIESHIEETQEQGMYLALSEQRALTLGQFLLEHEINMNRLLLYGYTTFQSIANIQFPLELALNQNIKIILKPVSSS